MIQELSQSEVKIFIKEHENDDPADLVLKYAGDKSLPISLIADQIRARKKAKSKAPFLYQNPEIIFPKGASLEQSSSQATAQYKADLIQGTSLTDLTGGFGIDTYFFAKKCKKVIHVEPNKDLSRLVKHNFKILGIQNVGFKNESAENHLENETNSSDCYFIDPSRRGDQNQRVFHLEDCSPNLENLLPNLHRRTANILIKLSPFIDIRQALSQIPRVSEVHVLSVRNECKEVLFKSNPNFDQEPKYFAIDINQGDIFSFQFDQSEEVKPVSYGLPECHLYEPNSSIMKAGGFNSVANKYALKKLHRNSHLYTSDELVSDFPGRKFRITKQVSLSRKKLQQSIPTNKVNITVRNFPETVAEIRKRTGLKEGGEFYLFATTLMDESLVGLLCTKV